MVFFDVESERGADEFAAARAIATTVHEAVHHLSYHTRIQKAAVQYPLWSGEGLATAFETSTPDKQFGPEYDFPPRRERFDRLLAAERLIPLRSFVGLDRMPDGRRETVHTVYNQAYAFGVLAGAGAAWGAPRLPDRHAEGAAGATHAAAASGVVQAGLWRRGRGRGGVVAL